MSDVFVIYCLDCYEDGPLIRRSTGGRAVVHEAGGPATKVAQAVGAFQLGDFLMKHTYHDMRLGLEAGVAHHHPRAERTA